MNVFCMKSSPPIGSLFISSHIKSTYSLEITYYYGASEDCVIHSDGTKFVYRTAVELARLLAKFGHDGDLMGRNAGEMSNVDSWLCFAAVQLSATGEPFLKAVDLLNRNTTHGKFLVGNRRTVADFMVLSTLIANPTFNPSDNVLAWFNRVRTLPAVIAAVAAAPHVFRGSLLVPATKPRDQRVDTADRGKFVDLPGAEMGKVTVRFPPEASGYLHIGHAKAALLNQYYQQTFAGRLIMRFDDTNPAKEDAHFEQAILQDVARLQIEPDLFTHTSQYFDEMLALCERLLVAGDAYADDTQPEQMRAEREARAPSAHRDNEYAKNLRMWQEMKAGSDYGQTCCVRAKIDMQSANGCMRDPTIYRCKSEPHPRTGTKYKVYPTYDFACPIVDALENVTHTLRTTEYRDRDAQFYWFIDKLQLRRPYIWDYSRLSMTNTVLSKRKLTWFVQEGHVDGWDDARMPTVRGVLRRGMTVEGLKQFIIAQGSSRSVVFMEWDKIWAFNKKIIDPIAPRLTALGVQGVVRVNVGGVKKVDTLSVQKHPKNADIGTKTVWISDTVCIDQKDALELKENENATFINWGNLMIKKIIKEDGVVKSIDADLNLEDKNYKKTPKLTWLAKTDEAVFTPTYCVYFDHLISKALLGKDEDFKQYIATDTRKEVQMFGDPELKQLKQGDIIQLQRIGFFRVDVAYKAANPFTCHEQPIVLFHIPDGHTKDTPSVEKTPQQKEISADKRCAATINSELNKQADLVRGLKSSKASKVDIDVAVKHLLSLKAEFKLVNGSDWKQGAIPSAETIMHDRSADTADLLTAKVTAQAEVVRTLKCEKAAKGDVDAAVKQLLDLKSTYKTLTGTDFPSVVRGNKSKTAVGKRDGANKERSPAKDAAEEVALKKHTRLCMEAKKEQSLSSWYSEVITKGEMIEYYDVSGCYILRPWSFAVWDAIREWLDAEIKKLGVQNCYFPIFVSKAVLEKEQAHIADFAPEVAWVTKSGNSAMSEPIAVRPTSETAMYPAYAKWIQSHRDLPIKLNQWNNVVRWEFSNPQPFLRTREFLWQEGHTAHATASAAQEEVRTVLELYARIYTDLLAVPVIRGRKTDREKFAGGVYTASVEAFVSASGRAVQGATSHFLGQNFSRMFDITYELPGRQEKTYVEQNSWGISTRTIGVMIMVHGDNTGLVLPPRVASVQCVIVPCGITAKSTESDRHKLQNNCTTVEEELRCGGVRVHGDYRDNLTPGWKYSHWELKGVPLRIEYGPKDIAVNQLIAVRRDTGEKVVLRRSDVVKSIQRLLDDIQTNLYDTALKDMDSHTVTVKSWDDFCASLERKNIILAPFCGEISCEEKIKADSSKTDAEIADPGAPSMGAKSLCIPFEQPAEIIATDVCIHPMCEKKPQFYTLFGRSY